MYQGTFDSNSGSDRNIAIPKISSEFLPAHSRSAITDRAWWETCRYLMNVSIPASATTTSRTSLLVPSFTPGARAKRTVSMIELKIVLVSEAHMRMIEVTHLTTGSEVLALCQNTFVVIYVVLPTVFGSGIVSKIAVGKPCLKELLTDSGWGIWRQSLNISFLNLASVIDGG